MSLETVELNPPNPPEGSIIWLHGLGADGHDFESVVPELNLGELNLRFVFPHAPVRPVTINDGMEMRAWYDMNPVSPLSGTEDINQSVQQIEELIAAELDRGMRTDKVLVAGFSQGGVVALQLSLAYHSKLAGVMALSTYIHDHEHLSERIGLANVDIPIFMAHGLMDPMIPITRAITSREALSSLNYSVEWHEYSMGHQLCMKEITDISNWLCRCFG